MLHWSDGQKYALRALGYRRWLLRSSLARGAPTPEKTVAPPAEPLATARAALATLLDEPAPVAAPAAPATPAPVQESQLLHWDFGQLLLDDNYCLLSSANLRYQWLLPPLLLEEGRWRLLRRAEADLLLRALINSGEGDEGRGLEPFFKIDFPAAAAGQRPLVLGAKTVALGNFVAKNLSEEQRHRVYYLSHPQFVLEQQAKRQLWLQIKGLKDY